MPAPIQLEYAPDPRKRRRRKWIIRAVIALAIVTPFLIAYLNRDEISLRVRRWYWARQVLAHVTPPGTVLLEYDRSKVANNPDYMIDASPSLFAPQAPQWGAGLRLPNPPAGYLPQVWREYSQLEPRTALFEPICQAPSPMIFLGERRTPSGGRRVVALAGGIVNALEFEESISKLVLPVPGILEKIPQTPGGVFATNWYTPSRHIHAVLQPGVADPTDPTHIIIDFQTQAQDIDKPARKGTLDVYLKDNDMLEFKLRDPSLLNGL